jgi:formate hydrogenlyase subunit 3/multisubunit Na+/H+ antiporter MnhD subunit
MVSAILVGAIVYLIFSILFLVFLTGQLDEFAWTVIGCGACAGVGSALLCALIEEGLAADAVEASNSTIGK